MLVNVIDHDTFEAFLDELRKRNAIRLVKLADYGFVAPLKIGSGAIVMAPQVRIVATAFDKARDALIRWPSAQGAKATATVGAAKTQETHAEKDPVQQVNKEDLRKRLELEGYSVADGEWTPGDIERLMAMSADSGRRA